VEIKNWEAFMQVLVKQGALALLRTSYSRAPARA
jgi:hypothetical protein